MSPLRDSPRYVEVCLVNPEPQKMKLQDEPIKKVCSSHIHLIFASVSPREQYFD